MYRDWSVYRSIWFVHFFISSQELSTGPCVKAGCSSRMMSVRTCGALLLYAATSLACRHHDGLAKHHIGESSLSHIRAGINRLYWLAAGDVLVKLTAAVRRSSFLLEVRFLGVRSEWERAMSGLLLHPPSTTEAA